MATYRYTNNGGASLKLTERPVYGSDRLGSYQREVELRNVPMYSNLQAYGPPAAQSLQVGRQRYELKDHLGNVTAVVTGRLLDGGSASPWQPELLSAQGYEPFGALLPGRNYSSASYRFGFNSQEKDDEVFGATGTSMTAEFWQYDTRTGRRWNLDPVPQVSISDYAVFSLNPIANVDPLGNSATKYEDKNGKVLGNTNDGNNSTVTIADDHLAEFNSEFSKAKGNDQQDGLMNNESWIRRFGDKMTVGSGDKAAPWAAQAMGYDANVLIPAAAGLVGTALEENASLILKKAARYDGFRAPYEPIKFPTRDVFVPTPFGKFELPKTTLGKVGTGLKVGGYALGAYQAFDLYNQKQQGLIGGSTYYLEQGSNVFGTFGGLYGAAWSVGWESGRFIMNRPAIKAWKNDTWLPWREKNLGY